MTEEKSKKKALLLCFFLGGFATHRRYLGIKNKSTNLFFVLGIINFIFSGIIVFIEKIANVANLYIPFLLPKPVWYAFDALTAVIFIWTILDFVKICCNDFKLPENFEMAFSTTKSKTKSLLLCIFTGNFAGHRLYLGKKSKATAILFILGILNFAFPFFPLKIGYQFRHLYYSAIYFIQDILCFCPYFSLITLSDYIIDPLYLIPQVALPILRASLFAVLCTWEIVEFVLICLNKFSLPDGTKMAETKIKKSEKPISESATSSESDQVLENDSELLSEIPKEYKPITMWGYFGYEILYLIPLIGQIILIMHALNAPNKNVKNFARSYFCFIIIGIIIGVLIGTIIKSIF